MPCKVARCRPHVASERSRKKKNYRVVVCSSAKAVYIAECSSQVASTGGALTAMMAASTHSKERVCYERRGQRHTIRK